MARREGLPNLADLGRDLFGGVRAAELLAPGRPLELAAPGEPLLAAVARMWWRRVGALPVVEGAVTGGAVRPAAGEGREGGGRLLGCVSEDDVLRLLGTRLRERMAGGESGGALRVWDDLMAGVRVADALVPAKELPVVAPECSLLEALDRACERVGPAPRCRYILVAGDPPEGPEGEAGGALLGVLSFRDVARFVTSVHEGTWGEGAAGAPALRRALRRVLDRWVAELVEAPGLGHAPVLVDLDGDAAAGFAAIHEGGRGYGLACLPDRQTLAICTRRDVIRALADPFADLRRLRMPALVTYDVKTLFPGGTLFGLFRRMALENCRHIPVTDEWDRVERVVSLWEAIWLLAHGAPPARA